MSVDTEQIADLEQILTDVLTAEELCEILGLTVPDLFNKFTDEIMEVNWGEIL